MTREITSLEVAFNRQLRELQAQGRPSEALLSAADQWSRAVWSVAEEQGPLGLSDTAVTQGLWLAERPIFVCGVHRSGTTLVRNLLDGHPQLSVLPSEGGLLTGYLAKLQRLPAAERVPVLGREWLRRLANPTNRPPSWLLGRSTSGGSPYVMFARRLLAWWPVVDSHFGARSALAPLIAVALAYTASSQDDNEAIRIQRWAEKTPTNEFHLLRLWAELPAAKVVHVVRDPWAVYASRKRLEEQSLGAFANVRRVLEDLAHSFEIAAANQNRRDFPEYRLVRYEDLLDHPQDVVAGLAAFLGIEPDSSLLRPTVANLPAYSNSSFGLRETSGSILAGAQEGHHDRLTAHEQELVGAFAGDAAAALGYPTAKLSSLRKWLVRMKVRSGSRASACFRRLRLAR